VNLVDERMEIVALARLATVADPPTTDGLAKTLLRFAPASLTEAMWHDHLVSVVSRLRDQGVVGAGTRVIRNDELSRRIGKYTGNTWGQLADRVLPALSLGIAASDAKTISRLSGRDAWTAAIAARALGLWTQGQPPSLTTVCDAYAWRELGLTGRPKRCPAEVRALFIQRELRTDAGKPDRLLRLFVARELGARRPDLRLLRDALVCKWLGGESLGHTRNFVEQVRTAAQTATDGVFGGRKIFISFAWRELVRSAAWSSLSLDEFKTRLLAAHRSGELVLARADLVAAMDPAVVAASETVADGASFHFIVRES
jgi:hypothetical protein